MTECECPLAGMCQRHKVQKSAHWHKLCQTRTDYFALWELGGGPGQERSQGLGDTVAKITRAIGIPECGGCKKRRKWLNDVFPYNNATPASDSDE